VIVLSRVVGKFGEDLCVILQFGLLVVGKFGEDLCVILQFSLFILAVTLERVSALV